MISYLFILSMMCGSTLPELVSPYSLIVNSSSPSTLDIPMIFSWNLQTQEDTMEEILPSSKKISNLSDSDRNKSPKFVFEWYDNAYPMQHRGKSNLTSNTSMDIVLTYVSEELHKPGDGYTLTVVAFQETEEIQDIKKMKKIAEGKTHFQLTSELTGSVSVVSQDEKSKLDSALINLISSAHMQHIREEKEYWNTISNLQEQRKNEDSEKGRKGPVLHQTVKKLVELKQADAVSNDPPSLQLISLGVKTKLTCDIHDPTLFIEEMGHQNNDSDGISYFWFINQTNYGQTHEGFFNHVFSDIGVSHVQVFAMVHLPPTPSSLNESIMVPSDEEGNDTTPNVLMDTFPAFNNSQERNLTSSLVKSGIFNTLVDVRRESSSTSSSMRIDGETSLIQGQIVNLSVSVLDGTGPWFYCWWLVKSDRTGIDPPYQISGFELCDDTESTYIDERFEDGCDFTIQYYFTSDGGQSSPTIYQILVIVDNGVSVVRKLVSLEISFVEKQSQTFYIVLPAILALILVVCVMSFAIFNFIRFRNRFIQNGANFTIFEEEDRPVTSKTSQTPDEHLFRAYYYNEIDDSNEMASCEYTTSFWARIKGSMYHVCLKSHNHNAHDTSSSSTSSQTSNRLSRANFPSDRQPPPSSHCLDVNGVSYSSDSSEPSVSDDCDSSDSSGASYQEGSPTDRGGEAKERRKRRIVVRRGGQMPTDSPLLSAAAADRRRRRNSDSSPVISHSFDD